MDVDFYFRALNEKLTALRAAVTALLAVLGDNSPNPKASGAQNALVAANALASVISEPDRPAWLGRLQQALERYTKKINKENEAHRLLNALIDTYPQMAAQRWDEASDAQTVDFEAVYRRYTEESRLEKLFDEMVSKLEAMISTGQIDSLRVIRALEAIVKTLRKNARSTYFARLGAWDVATAFFRNFVWEGLSEIPGFGAATRALRTTYDQLDAELNSVRTRAQGEIGRLTESAPELAAPRQPLRLTAGESDQPGDVEHPGDNGDIDSESAPDAIQKEIGEASA